MNPEVTYSLPDYQTASGATDIMMHTMERYEVGMPTSLAELGINPTQEQLEELAEKCVSASNGSVGFLQKLVKDDILRIYQRAM